MGTKQSAVMELSKNELLDIIAAGAEKAIARLGIVRDGISQREAYLEFGEGFINRLENADLIENKVKIGGERNSKIIYSRSELRALQMLYNRGLLKNI